MSSYDAPRSVNLCKSLIRQKICNDHEVLMGRVAKNRGLASLVARYHEIGRQIEKEMMYKYSSEKTIVAMYAARTEIAGTLSRQGIKVADKINPEIVAKYAATCSDTMAQMLKSRQK